MKTLLKVALWATVLVILGLILTGVGVAVPESRKYILWGLAGVAILVVLVVGWRLIPHHKGGGHEGGFFPHTLAGWLGIGILVWLLVGWIVETVRIWRNPTPPARVEQEVAIEAQKASRYFRTGTWEATLSPGDKFTDWLEHPSGYMTSWRIKSPSSGLVQIQTGRVVEGRIVQDTSAPQVVRDNVSFVTGDAVRFGAFTNAVTLIFTRVHR